MFASRFSTQSSFSASRPLTETELRRAANGGRMATRAVTGIDQDVKINRALWTLAEEMKRLKAA